MEKIKILGVGKGPRYSHYTFTKKQGIFNVTRDLLEKLGFCKMNYLDFGQHEDKYGKLKEDDIKSKAYIDSRFSLGDGEYLIEVIFGRSRVFLSIRSEKDRQEKIAKILKRYW